MWIPHEISIAYPYVSNSQLKGIYNTQIILEECIIDNEAKPELGIYVPPLEQTDNPPWQLPPSIHRTTRRVATDFGCDTLSIYTIVLIDFYGHLLVQPVPVL